MNTFLVTWNPKSWPWETLGYDANQTEKGNAVAERWSCGNRKKIEVGDRLFLLKQGPKLPRGIIASGKATSGVYRDKHWNAEKAAAGKKARYVEADWDTILNFKTEPLLQTSKIDGRGSPKVNWKTQSSGIAVSLPVAERIELLWRKHIEEVRGNPSSARKVIAIGSGLADEGYFDPLDLKDEREKQLREIAQRRGQPEFRIKLITAYHGRCAISGSDAVDALEAAHIIPYKGPKSQHITNGLLLRADIHTLFDLNLLGIEPSSLKVVLSPKLLKTCLRELGENKLALPDDAHQHPSKEALGERWKQFKGEA